MDVKRIIWFILLISAEINFVLTHVLNYDSVTVCDGVLKEVQCPNEENIHVLQGFYGKWRNHDCKGESVDPDNLPTCRQDSSKTFNSLKEKCQGKNTCTLIADKSIYGEPCPDNKAYLYMTFFCMKNGQKLKHHKTKSNEWVVTVPSHGYIVREEKVHLEEDRRKKEEEDAKRTQLVRSGDPSLLTPNPKPTADITDNIKGKKAQTKLVDNSLKLVKLSGPKAKKVQTKLVNVNLKKSTSRKHLATGTTELVDKENAPIFSSVEDALKIEDALNEGKERSSESSNRPKLELKSIVASNKDAKKDRVDGGDSQDKLLSKEKSEIVDYLLKEHDAPLKKSELSRKKGSVVVNENSKLATSNEVGNKDTSSSSINTKLDKIAEQLEKDDVTLANASSIDENPSNETISDLRSTIICNGASKLIACLPEEGIQIHNTFYGKRVGEDCHGKLPYKDDAPTCSALDARSTIEESCANKQTCLLFADENRYGKSLCPLVNKYLDVSYTCSPLPSEEERKKAEEQKHTEEGKNNVTSNSTSTFNFNVTALAEQNALEEEAVTRTLKDLARVNTTERICNGEKKTLKCDRDSGMTIMSAFYGKKAGNDCRGKLSYRDDIPDCDNPRAMDKLKMLCEKQTSCEVEAEMSSFGQDVCPGVNKYLDVTYAC